MTLYNIFLIVILIIAFLLILIIMVQNPKGGGIDSTFGGGGSQLGGVQSTNKFLDRTTWTLAISLFVLILLSNFVVDRGVTTKSLTNTDGATIIDNTKTDEPKAEDVANPIKTEEKKETD